MELFGSPMVMAIVSAIVVFILYMSIDAVLGRKQRRRINRLSEYGDAGYTEDELVSLEQDKSGGAATCEEVMSAVGINVPLGLEEWGAMCRHAGIANPNSPSYYLFFQKLVGPAIALLGGLYAFAAWNGEGDPLLDVTVGLVIVVLGLFGAKIWVKNLAQKRQEKLLRSFPDTLDLLVVCVESGLALDAALARVCKELGRAYPEITEELNQTRVELALLNDRPRALINLAERTNLLPFRSLVAALIQTEKFGTSLTDTLRVLSEDYRLTRLLLAEQKAGRLPALMTVPLILLLMPAFILVILGPPFILVNRQGGIFGGD